ncbi:ubiquitin carboxyl-terminal hydrolase 2 [Procambarus clarkii]|uniref:ubiquitin carboxyl-terminal hydrolase 2 n=1 Tax=Procambarus clarkii TaxID=6728 RepID=UPI001E675ED9|nr:ubiquitin carboxyl-terminal hydrolase 2-like [Procambarus clarkii]XP_045619214.1 ubiquitin carboxyl-terminal hydrolase 2-like [Procambarus clarkii]
MKPSQLKLLSCAEDGDAVGVREALVRGAQVNQLEEDRNDPSCSGRAALHYATREGHLNVVRVLLQWNADVNIRSRRPDDDGAPPLHMAAYAGHVEVMKSLLEGGADGEAKDSKGKTAVHWAALQGQLDSLKLLKNYHCDLSAKVERKANAMHFAVASGDLEVVAWLLENGVRSDQKDKDKKLPLDLAKRLGHTHIHTFLKPTGSLRYKLRMFNKSSFLARSQTSGSYRAPQSPDAQDSPGAPSGAWRNDSSSEPSRWMTHFPATGRHRKDFSEIEREAEAGPSRETRLEASRPTGERRSSKEVLKEEARDVRRLQEGLQRGEECQSPDLDTGAVSIARLSRQLDHTLQLLLQTNRRLDQTIQDLEHTNHRLEQSNQLLQQTNNQLEQVKQSLNLSNQQLDLTKQQLDQTNQQLRETKQQLEQTNQRQEQTNHRQDQTNQRQDQTNQRQDQTKQQLTEHGGNEHHVTSHSAPHKLSTSSNDPPGNHSEVHTTAPNHSEVASPSGLPNLGNTCYINSVIQCLFNINSFRDYFINDTYRFQVNRESEHRGEVAHTLAGTMKALHSGDFDSIRDAAKVLKHVVGAQDEEFEGSHQHDAHDLLADLLTWLHNDLMKANWSSVVSELFHGEEEALIICEERSEETLISSTCQPFISITLPVNHAHPCQLQMLLERHYEPQRIEWDCKPCGRSHLCRHEIRIVHFPPLLVIHLSRYNGRDPQAATKTSVRFPTEDLHLQGHKTPSPRYEACGLVVHHGTMTAGHYVAFCRNDNGSNTWRLYDDDTVTSTDLNTVLDQNQVHLLFYRMNE